VELDSEMEAIGYRLRNARMADYGFPDFEEALEIYRFVNPDSLTLERDSSASRIPGGTEKISPPFYLTFQEEGPFLSSVLLRIDDPQERNRIKIEMEIKNGLRNALCSMEADENRRIHLLAFKDFCLDLFEEEFGRIPSEEEIDPRFVRGLFIRK
jgi:hypothetical protein